MVDDYEIMPYKEIVELKKQIAELQKKTGDTSSQELLNSMAALTKSMNNMLQLFSTAAEEMKLEEKTESELSKQIGPLIEKINNLEEQNKTIAEGLVAVADMVKELRGERARRERELRATTQKERPAERKPIPSPMPPSFESSELPPLEEPESELPSFDSELPPLEPPELPPLGPPPTRPIPDFMPRQPSRGMPAMPPPRMFPGPMPPRAPPMGLGPLPPLPPLEEKPRKGFLGMFKKK